MSKNTILIIVISLLSTLFTSCVEEEEMYTQEEVEALLEKWDYSDLEEGSCPIIVDCHNNSLAAFGDRISTNDCEDDNYSKSCLECVYKEYLQESSCVEIDRACDCPKNQVVDDNNNNDDYVSDSTLCKFIRDDLEDDGCEFISLSSTSCNNYMDNDSTFRNCVKVAYFYNKNCSDADQCIKDLHKKK